MYYLRIENKDADQLHGYCAADLCLWFSNMQKSRFSGTEQIIKAEENKFSIRKYDGMSEIWHLFYTSQQSGAKKVYFSFLQMNLITMRKPGPEVITLFSCSTLLSMKFNCS